MSVNSRNSKLPSPTRIAKEIKHSSHFYNILPERSLGFKRKIGVCDSVVSKLYNSFDAINISSYSKCDKYWGGIFNLEFSLDGKGRSEVQMGSPNLQVMGELFLGCAHGLESNKLVVAACEGKQILLFDAANQKQINTVEQAHQSCVNCVRFLNDKTFATCSDDTSIKLWDIRNIKSEIKTLHGHSNWVKNIEWSETEQVLVTSAFDGSIFAWNLANMSEHSMLFDKVFLMNGLMRMKITPDGTKMIISTTTGYMIIIHNLNLLTLATDLRSFRPNLYRLMQTSEQSFPVGTIYNYLFNPNRKRNRLEFIDDFPNEAEVISSLQIHPHGWCALSRNLNGLENEEWTTIHDIQDREQSDYENNYTYVEDEEPEDADNSDIEEGNNRRPTDLWMGYITLEDIGNIIAPSDRDDQRNPAWDNLHVPSMSIVNSGLIGWNASYNTYLQQHPEERNKVIKNLPRMTHFVKEKSAGKGFIKELCFSSDGRIICSPYDKGVRLLAFNENCQELTYCVPDRPKQLTPIVEMNDYHKDTVVSCKFSPVHYQMVSGCLGSEIRWYQPVL